MLVNLRFYIQVVSTILIMIFVFMNFWGIGPQTDSFKLYFSLVW